MDVSGDGIPELMIGYDTEGYEGQDKQSNVLSLFSIKDGKPVAAFESWARSSHQWIGDGHFFYSGSNGAASTLFGEHHISKDGTEVVWDDFYFSDETPSGDIAFYHNKTGMYDAAASEVVNMPEEDFWKLMDGYKSELLSWKPVRQWEH